MADSPKDLFNADPSRKSLILGTKSRSSLTKAQQTFNRLVKKIEKLHAQIRDQTSRLNETLAFSEEHIRPLESGILAYRKELVLTLAPFLAPGKLKKDECKILRYVLENQLASIVSEEGSLPQDMQSAFEKVHGITFEQAMRNEMESTQSEMKEMFEAFGIDVDLSGLRPDMSQEEMATEAARITARLKAEHDRLGDEPEPEPRPRKKASTTRQEQERQKEEARKTSLSKIYRDLARVLHPDLEPDDSIRPQKVQLMSRFTAAYRENDLHTLLKLELEWLTREEGDLSRMTDEKLGIYNRVLEEQARELQTQLQELPLQPQYRNIVRQLSTTKFQILTDPRQELQELSAMLSYMEQIVLRLRKGMALGEIRQIVRDYRASNR